MKKITITANMALTSQSWRGVWSQLSHGLILVQERDVCLVRLGKCLLNLPYRALVALSSLVILIVTPFLFLCDVMYGKTTINVTLYKKVKKADTVLGFYQGGVNWNGVTLEEIWKYSPEELESHHNFIQWLFPLREKGMWTAPVTNDITIAAFKQHEELKGKMLQSFKLMLKFYGLVLKDDKSIDLAPDFEKRSQWLNPGNHNFLRITRILKSLMLHGLSGYAKNFFDALAKKIYPKYKTAIGETSFKFWKNAIKD